MSCRCPFIKICLTQMPSVFKLWTYTNGLGKVPTPCGSLGDIFYIIFMNQELSIKIIRELEKTPEQSQRALSKRCGVSLGSIHYCINALVEKGYVKARNFRNAQNKLAYAYILTPSGMNLKKELTLAFLRRKQEEYEALQREIKELEEDLERWRRCSWLLKRGEQASKSFAW